MANSKNSFGKTGDAMYRNAVKESLLHLVGWRQNYDTTKARVGESLTQTDSGNYFQDVHPLLTLENVKSIAPEFARTTIAHYDPAKIYRIGELCNSASVNYICLIPSQDKTPLSHPLLWGIWDGFTEWLTDKTGASVLNAIRTWMNEKTNDKTLKNILENKVLFDGSGRIVDTVYNFHSIVGFEIVPIRAKGVTLKIEKIGLQFKGTGLIRLYLMHTSSMIPIKTIDVNRTKDGSMQWFDQTDLFLPYVSDLTDAGGSWFLCYDQNETDQTAIFKTYDWSTGPCGSCSRQELLYYRSWSKYMEIHPFKITHQRDGQTGLLYDDSLEMWDVSHNLHSYDTNYGINLQVTLSCDITDFIIEQKDSFKTVIGLQVACDLIREMAYNPNFRINRLSQNFQTSELLYELDGDSRGKKSGLNYQLQLAMKALKLDTSGIDRICLPCNNNGIKYSSV